MEYSKEFKEALSNFSPKEKDKLIFRLLKKDPILSQKLYFELIDTQTVDEKRHLLEESLTEKVALYSKNVTNPKYYLMLIRKLSGEISLHVKVTSDKFGEVYLNLLLVNAVLRSYKSRLERQSSDKNHKLYLYLINKIFRALTYAVKLDEDYFMDIDVILQETLEAAQENAQFQKLCLHHFLQFSYFRAEDIPKNMAEVVRELKADGFLK